MFIVLLLLYPSFALLYAMDELKDPVVTVRAIGHQWYWTYEMPTSEVDKLASVLSFDSYMLQDADLKLGSFRLLEVDRPLVLPVNAQTRLLISSADVLHSWAVPSFGVKMDACPGRLNQTGIFIERRGTFFGQCSELCGVNHGFMPITVKAVSVDDF